MSTPSITSSESFESRAQRSEAARVVLWILALIVMVLLTLTRRAKQGVVMSDNAIFYPYIGTLLLALAVQFVLLFVLTRANRRGEPLAGWIWRGSAVFDLAVAAALLVIASLRSPRGPIPALSSPALLLMPLVILLSVLRLRPTFTLYTGLTGAAFHLALAVRAIRVTDAMPEAYPVYLSYSVILALTALAGMFVAAKVKAHVREAAHEAAAHERADRQVFGMQRDLAVARDIQRGLLPTRSPQLSGYDIVGMNRPADQTGGDYYDWQPLPDGRLAVVIADVTGHGIGPALVMAICRAYSRAAAPLTPDPAALMTRLNKLLHDDLPGDRFITLVLAVLEDSGRVQLISAGHGPTLLYRANTGDVAQFGGDGIPLGVMATEEYGPATSLALDEGDVLVLLTDGFFEWARPGDRELFGIPRLQNALRAAAPKDAAAILRSIDQAVVNFGEGSSQPDDMTAIVIKRTSRAVAAATSHMQLSRANADSSITIAPN